ncbi:hypothetical protein IF2G_01222 [Cordyceps javanica]|nr:hypothetical protein IF2G_01222 [Cordyceps javanica]
MLLVPYLQGNLGRYQDQVAQGSLRHLILAHPSSISRLGQANPCLSERSEREPSVQFVTTEPSKFYESWQRLEG